MVSKNKNAGGAATQAGIIYQNRVAAWFCVRILAEHLSAPLWNLQSDTTFDFLRCETEQPVDDILIGTSAGGYIFVNVKHKVNASKISDSSLGSAINQFIRQFTSYKADVKGTRPWERQLNSDIDRLVLITPSTSPVAIKESLPNALSKIRNKSSLDRLDDLINSFPETEKDISAIFRKQLAKAWVNTTGSQITEEDELQLFKLIWIEILDIDDGKIGEREAKQLLKTTILKNPVESESAWNSLIRACDDFGRKRSGADRSLLQQHLIAENIRLTISQSYQEDIQKLHLQTKETLDLLKDYSTIRVGRTEVKINRLSTESLLAAAEDNSIIVVGEPGAGKSGALYDVVDKLIEQNRDVIFFAVDKLKAESINELKNELDLEHSVIEIMKNWSGGEPAFLVIDAMDAARSASTAQAFYDLISLVLQSPQRWRIIVSIRKFDLRHNLKLRRLFAGSPPTEFKAVEFYDICHFNVPRLSGEEWLQIPAQSIELAELITRVQSTFRALLEVPFNLRLAGELLGNGLSIENLSTVETQIDLLDLYWETRIKGKDKEGDARQAVLFKVIESMLKTRTLRADRRIIASEPSFSNPLYQLLSSHILLETELPNGKVKNNELSFAHHVLFDYAVSNLLFRGGTENLLQTLENDNDLVLAIRPSIVMHFQHLWLSDSSLFWEVYFGVIGSEVIPEIGKLIGSTVAAEFGAYIENFTVLINALKGENIYRREIAEKAFRHLTGALLVDTSTDSISKVIGNNASPWCELLDICTLPMHTSLVYSIRPLLWILCKNSDLFTEDQRNYAGRIARRLLAFSLSLEPRETSLVISGIETVCRTFESDPVASAKELRKCLTPIHVNEFGHEELFHLGQQIEKLAEVDPVLVEEIYTAAFTNFDDSDEKTSMIGSRIMPMSSTRRQDFQMAQYAFAKSYSKFLEVAPLHAVRSLIISIKSYIDKRNEDDFWNLGKHFQENEKKPLYEKEKFLFGNKEAFFLTDHSSIWNEGISSGNEHSLEMLSTFEYYLETLSSNEQHSSTRKKILDLIVHENFHAVLWRSLIECGIKYPTTLGYEIRFLAWANPILTSFDTTVLIGNFINKIFTELSKEERKKIEKAILQIPALVPVEHFEKAEHQRNRLLGCLNKEFVILEKTKIIINRLEAEQSIPSNEPFFRNSGVTSSQYTDEDYLRDEGVSFEDENNRQAYDLTQPVKAFVSKHQNSVPTEEEFISIIPYLRELHQSLISDEAGNIHERQRDLAWSYLIDACADATKIENWLCETDNARFIKTVLLEGAESANPLPDSISEENFDDHPAWGPSARIAAAEGIIRLARHKSCLDDEVIRKIKRLGLKDKVPAVRFQIAINLTYLYQSDIDLMWHLLEKISLEEERKGILKFFVNGSLNRLAGHHPDKITELTKIIFERVREGKGSGDVRKYCTSIFLGLYLWRDQQVCKELINEIIKDPLVYNTEAHQIAFDLRETMNLGLDDLSNCEKKVIRRKAFNILEEILKATAVSTETLEKKNELSPFNEWTEKDKQDIRNVAHLADSIGNQIYFASGAYKETNDKVPMETEARQVFFKEALKSFELLSNFGYAGLTHHLLETLEFFSPYSPEEIFILIGNVVLSGKRSGYQYESLGVDLIVKLVERFIAEFPDAFQKNEKCRRMLIEILDVFVDAGWASARQLTYRLEDIFR